MGSAPVGLGPRFLARSQVRRIGQTLGCNRALESGQPMVIVTRAVVGLTAARGGAEFIGQRDRPFLPSELPLLRELDASANASACQGSANTGSSASRERRWSTATLSSSGIGLGWLKVVVPHIDANRIARRGLVAPQFARGEAD